MRFLLFTLEYPPFKGGVADYYEKIAEHWPEKENIFVLHNNRGRLISRVLPFFKWLPSLWRLAIFCKAKKINHVLVGNILPLGIPAYVLHKLFSLEYSVILHGLDYNFAFKTERKSFITRRILAGAEKIICANSYVAGLVAEENGGPLKDKIIISNPGINLFGEEAKEKAGHELAEKIREKYGLKGKTVMLSLGRLVKRKGADYVLKIFPKALAKAPDLVYVIAGTGPDENYLKEKWQDLPTTAKARVIFAGKPSDEEKWAWLSLCDFFIMPSRRIKGDAEGFGIVYLEANLAGKPVIAGDSGGVRDAVVNGVNGLLVNPEEKDEILKAIIALAKDPELRRTLGEAGRKRVFAEFDAKKRVIRLYEALK
ncbi:MAG: glycosyltransferase family 4 protein [Patescibacteria group bacterium]|jgi:phosphatidylinositol alpha-1,6-mannosyltransferase